MSVAVSEKAAHLLAALDLARPELAGIASAEEYAAFVARGPRPRFRVEYEEKARVLAFLREQYAAWRDFDTAAAERFRAMTIAKAQGERALAGIAALGQAWWATGDPAYGAAFERFYLAVPTGEMFNWGSFNGTQGAIELNAFFLLQDCPGFTPAGRVAFLDHLYGITEVAWDVETSRWQQLMLGPEGHNWYLHGMRVLPFLGILFPEFARSAFFLKVGMSVVEEHLRGHYLADGGARETTLGYQAGSMQNLWDFYLIAQRNGYPLSAGFADRLLTATKFLLRLMTPLGGLPSFGDGGHTPGGLTSLAATAAALTGDGECKWYAEACRRQRAAPAETPGEIPLCAFWNVGLAGAATYAATRARDPRHVSVLMGPTGYAALRDGDQYLAIAAANRGPIVTSHGHNDVFALDVCAGGARVLGEDGCAPYGDSPGRLYDQTTAAHNTLTVDGGEQAVILDEWRWDSHVIPQVRRWISAPTHDFFHGVHEGYYHYRRESTLHARKVFFLKGHYWAVLDWLEADREHAYQAYFHGLVPGAADGATVLLGAAPRLAIIPPAGDALTLARVDDPGLSAYLEERRLDPDTHPCFRYEARAASTCLAWVLLPQSAPAPLPTVRRLPVTVNGLPEEAHGATALELRFPDYTDYLCVSHKDFDGELAFAGITTWGFLAFRRVDEAGNVLLEIEQTMMDGVCGR
ncbi:MAG TPA: alginate lyase family protein [Armatimonadota bacterium]|nr:alginate lyase family protein [Armatimonadota bacterium]